MIRISLIGSLNSIEKYLIDIYNSGLCLIVGIFCEPKGNKVSSLSDHPARLFNTPQELFEISDGVIFTDPETQHFELIQEALKCSRHVFLFPDIRLSFVKLEKLYKLSEEAGVLLYIRHKIVQPKLRSILDNHCVNPEYIDIYRYLKHGKLEPGKSILESLYNEIIFILAINTASVRRFYSSSVPYFSPDPYFINVRIEFENTSAANLTVNGYTDINSRLTEIFSRDKMILIDNFRSGIKIIRTNPNETFHFDIPADPNHEKGIISEMLDFIKKIANNDYKLKTFSTGVINQKIAAEILHHIIPQLEKTK
jgi:predicted dehydrogenase